MSNFNDFFDYILGKRYLSDHDFVRKHSYIHPNGFTKIVFPSFSEFVEEYRFHYWPMSGSCSDVHNHTSDFKSLVIGAR